MSSGNENDKIKTTNPNTKLKGISSIIGSILYHFVIALIYPLSSFYPYLMSYLHYYDQKITNQHGYFIFPIISFITIISSPFGGYLYFKIGTHRAVILGTFLFTGVSVGLYFSTNLYIDYALVVLYGVGIGISSGSTSKNACHYFPKNRGLVIALCGSFFTLGIAGFNILGELIINPRSAQPDGNKIYPFEVASKIKTFFLVQVGLFCFLSLLALFFIFPYQHTSEEIKQLNQDKDTNLEINQGDSLIPDNYEPGFTEEEINDETNEKVNPNEFTFHHIKLAINSWRVWRLFIITFCLSFMVSLIQTTSRAIGINVNVRTIYLQIIGTGGFLIGCVCGPIWGVLIDKIRFRIIYCILNISIVVIGFGYYFCIYSEILYLIINLAIALPFSGFFLVLIPHIMKVFGMKYFIEITGIINLSSGISHLISAVFAFLVDTFLEKNPNLSYLITFMVGGCLSIVGAVLGFFEDDTEFIYNL